MLKLKVNRKHWFEAFAISSLLLAAAQIMVAAESPQAGTLAGSRFYNWQALACMATNAETKILIVPDLGGRIMRYEVMGENILWDNQVTPEMAARMTKRDLLAGGYQMHVAPETANIGAPTRLEFGPYKVAGRRDYEVLLASETDIISGLQLEKEILLDPEKGDVGILQRVKNTGIKEMALSIRARTQCRSGGFVLAPLNKYSRFRAGWTLRHEVDDKAVYDSLNPASPQVKNLGHILVVEASGPETRIGLDSDAEWIAYVLDRSMFVQYFPYDFRAKYPKGGHTLEIGWNDIWTEIELLGPIVEVAGGSDKTQAIKWAMIPLKEPVRTAKQARALASKVPPSPFKPATK